MQSPQGSFVQEFIYVAFVSTTGVRLNVYVAFTNAKAGLQQVLLSKKKTGVNMRMGEMLMGKFGATSPKKKPNVLSAFEEINKIAETYAPQEPTFVIENI